MSRHVLYRMFHADGDLLYVGLTKNPAARFKQHADSKDWWTTVAQITVEHFSTREELAIAEVAAIRNEHPRHNVTHNAVRIESNGFSSSWEEDDYEDFLMHLVCKQLDVDRLINPDYDARVLYGEYLSDFRTAIPPSEWRARGLAPVYEDVDDSNGDGWELVEYEPEVSA